MKNKVLMWTIFICSFLFAVTRIYNYYYANFPVAQPGECIVMEVTPEYKLKAFIMQNNDKTKSSTVIIKVTDQLTVPREIEYYVLRELNSKKVPCNE